MILSKSDFMRTLFISAISLSILFILSCKDDGSPVVAYLYHAHIMEPSSAAKNLGDVLHISIEFESHSGEPVEHINVMIFNKATNIIVYDQPTDPHVGNGSDTYDFVDHVTLSTANGFSTGDWVLEAKVWGAEHEQDQVTERVEFAIH